MRKLPQKTAVIILAAGSSSRMKTVKQLLPWKHTTLIGNAIEQALSSNADDVYVVLGANHEIIFKAIEKDNVHIIYHKNWSLGMGSSIAFAMGIIGENSKIYDAVLITLTDQPLIYVNYINRLINKSKENIIIASNHKGKAGVPAIFSSAYFDELNKLKGDIGARNLLIKHKNKVVILDVLERIIDTDSLSAYELIYQKYGIIEL